MIMMDTRSERDFHNKELAWKTFVDSGEIRRDAVSPSIAESWLKCANTGVNPADGKGRVVLEQGALKQLVAKMKH